MPTPSVPVSNETVSVLTNLQQLLAAGASPETVSQWVAEALVQHQTNPPPDVTSPALHAVQQTQPTQVQPSHNITVISPSHARRDRPHSSRNTNIPSTTVQPPCPPRRGVKGDEEEDEEGNPLGQRSPRQCGHRVPISQKAQSQPQTMRLPTTTTTTFSTSIASPSHGVLPELKQSMTSIRSEVLEHRLRYNASTTTVGSHSAYTTPCGAPGNESQSGPYMSQSHNTSTTTTTTATSLRPANATSESNSGAIAGRRLERNELHDITTVLGSAFSRTTDRYSTYTALRNTMNSSPNSAPVQSNSRNFIKDEPSLRQELLLQRQTMENSSTSAVGGGVRLRPLSTPLRPMQAFASSTNATVRPCEQPSPQHTALNNIAVVAEEDSFTSPLATCARQAKTKGAFLTNNNSSAAYRAESADAAFVLRRTGRNGENKGSGAEAGNIAGRVTHRVHQQQGQQGQVSQGAENDERAAEEYDAGTALDDFYLPLAEISVASSARWVPENKTRTPNCPRRRRKHQQHPHSSPTQQQQEQHSQGNSHRHRGHRGAHRSRKQRHCRRRSSSLTRPASQERRTTAVPSATTTTTTTTQALQVERDEESSGSVVVVAGGKKEKPTRKNEGGPCVTTQDGTEGIQEFARPPIQLPFPSSRRLRGSSVSFSCSLQSNTSRTPSPTLRRGGSGASGNSGNGERVPNENNNNNDTNNNEKATADGVTEGHELSHRAAMAAATMRSRAKESTSIHSRTNSSNRTTTTTTTTSGDEEEDEDSYYDEGDEEEDDVDNEESYVMSWGEASGLGEDSLAEHCRMRGALSGAEESKSMLEFNLASASGGGASVAHGASLLDLSRSATCGLAATSSSYLVHHAVPALVEDGSTTRSMTTQSQEDNEGGKDKDGAGNGTSGPCRTSVLRLDEGEEKGSRGVTMNNATAAMQEHLVRRVRVMPEFVLDGRCRRSTDPNSPSSHRHNTATTHSESCGCEAMSPLRFARLVIRDTYVRVPLGWTRARLADLGIPFIDGLDIDPASEPLEPYGTPLIMRLVQQYKERLYVYLCINILLRYSFAARFRFDLNKLHHFFQDTASYFRPGIALRNIVHAADTALAAHQWLCYHDIAVHFTDDEIFAFLFTAMMVNVGHTGVDNTVLTQIRHPYATVCGYIAPQQGATISLVLALLAREENHFFPSGTPAVADVSTNNTVRDAVDTNKASAEAVAEAPSDDMKPTTTTTSNNGGGSNVPRPPSQPPRCSSGSGIPAANGSFARSTTTTALMTSAAACEWSAAMEVQFMDLFAELTMGRDLRNLNTINEQLARIAQESGMVEQSNTTREGVLYDASAGRPSALHGSPTRRFPSSAATTHNAPRKAIVLTDAHVRPVLTAILYLVHYPHIFRNRTMYFTCSCLFSAQIYRQSRVQARYITFRTHRPASAPNNNKNNQQDGPDTREVMCSAEAGKDTTKVTLQSAADNKTGITVTNESHETQNSDDAASKTMTTEEQLDAELDEMRRFLLGYPAHGIALDVLLVARETLYNPLLAKLTPYVPPSWIAAAEDNYSHLLAHLPSATMYDCCVGLALRSGQPAEPSSWAALRQWVPAEFDYDFLCDHIRVDPYWELNEEAFTRRVMQTIIQSANLDL